MSKNITVLLVSLFCCCTLASIANCQTEKKSVQQSHQSKRSRARFVDVSIKQEADSKRTVLFSPEVEIKQVSLQDEVEPQIVQPNSPVQLDIHERAYSSRKIKDISISIEPSLELQPEDLSVKLIERGASVGSWEVFADRTVCWPSPGITYRPLYFEDVRLERYGQVRYPLVQPWRGAIHYFGSIAALPVIMYQQPPLECDYPLGYCRPGNVVPYTWDRWWIR